MPWPMRFGPPPRMMIFSLSRRPRLALRRSGEAELVGRVHIGGWRGELRRAGVDALVDRVHVERPALLGDLARLHAGKLRQPLVGEAHGLQHAELRGARRQPVLAHARLHIHDVLDLPDEPRVDLARLEDLLLVEAEPQRLRHFEQPVGGGGAEGGADDVLVVALAEAWKRDVVEPGQARLHRAQRLLQRLREGAADGHGLADRLHRGGEHRLGAGEFLEGEARDLGHHIVDGRLEACRRRAAGDVVGELVERVADGELGRDLGDGKARGLRGKRGRARHARVHLDDDEAPVGRVHRELHVRSAGLHPDLAQHRDRGVAHDLIFLVGQRQRRRHGDRVAGVHAHRVDILDGADDDAVVVLIADDLHLVFLPAEHRFLDQHLAGRRGVEAALDDLQELLAVIGDAAAGAAKGEGGADDGRKADIRQRLQRLDQALLHIAPPPRPFALRPGMLEGGERGSALGRVGDLGDARGLGLVFLAVGALQHGGIGEPRARRLEPDLGHRLAEQLAVLGLVDRLGPRADHLHPVFVEHAGAMQAERGVERRLPAHGGQDARRAAPSR